MRLRQRYVIPYVRAVGIDKGGRGGDGIATDCRATCNYLRRGKRFYFLKLLAARVLVGPPQWCFFHVECSGVFMDRPIRGLFFCMFVQHFNLNYFLVSFLFSKQSNCLVGGHKCSEKDAAFVCVCVCVCVCLCMHIACTQLMSSRSIQPG